VTQLVSLFDVAETDTFRPVHEMTVSRVPSADVMEFCRRWHYAKTGGNMTWNYGIWDEFTLVGVVSYNLPTMPACSAFFGPERWEWVAHMGRLVCAEDAPRNTESRLISQSLRLLKLDRPVCRAVVSYAAIGQGHVGYVYQATNALYCGVTSKSHYYVDDKGNRRAPKQGRNLSIPKALARGWTVEYEPPKHRYLYLLGNRTERREARRLLKFETGPYPKQVAS
jgi:hypothetical protein